ncbi:hypothetical protein [Luedemannella helvata]|uniref:Uncharacterized protein n=1 Tax=Luedemannella helvata TaxID=349315 RepID=A0ABN2KEB0_9ACTN
MPVTVSQQDQRGARPLVILFWSGVGLAPLAALLFLVGVTSLGGVLAVLTMVLIGLSITLRRDSDSVRIELQETLLGELDQLRNDVRDDMATAARNTHRTLTERINVLTETVERVRNQAEGIEAVRVQLQQLRVQVEELQSRPAQQVSAVPQQRQAAAPPGAPGVVRTETVEVTRRTMTVEGEERGTVYGSRNAEEPVSSGARRGGGRRRAADEDFEDWDDSNPRWTPGARGERQQDWDEPPQSWRAEEWHEPTGGGRRRRETDSRADRQRDAVVEGQWEGTAHGDRWAAVRADEHGRELRVGEHRSSVRSDAHGTEMRVEDRWAAVRRAEREGSHGVPQPTWVPPREAGPAPRALPASRGESPQAYTGGGRRAAPDPEWERGADPEWERGVRERREERDQTEGRTARESKLVRAHRDADAREHRDGRLEEREGGGRHEGRRRASGDAAPRSHRSNGRDRDREDHQHVGAEYDWSPLQDFGAVEDDDEWGGEPNSGGGAYTGGSWSVPRQRAAEEYDRWR